MKQLMLAAVRFERYANTTRRAAFLTEMEWVVPWPALCALIEPFYPKPGNGRPPVGVEVGIGPKVSDHPRWMFFTQPKSCRLSQPRLINEFRPLICYRSANGRDLAQYYCW
jgi:hypothetical protein